MVAQIQPTPVPLHPLPSPPPTPPEPPPLSPEEAPELWVDGVYYPPHPTPCYDPPPTPQEAPELWVDGVYYMDCDGEPVASNTEQFEIIVRIKGNLDILFRDNPNVLIAGDLFWYPIAGSNQIKYAPDIFVALGRPKARRLSYLQWQEGNQPPQVVFEILSPSNTRKEMQKKLLFYNLTFPVK